MEEKRYRILAVDDEVNILSSLRRLLRRENYELLTANSGEEGLRILKEEGEINLIISDQRMPGMQGVEFLKKAMELYPDTIRIILSGYTDVSAITAAINEGHIYQFILKPWNDEELKSIIRRALEQWELQMENRGLTEKIRRQNEELKILNQDLEKKVEERTEELVIRNKALMLSQEIVDHLPVGVIGIDKEGTIVFFNEAAPRFFGGTGANALGSKAEEVLPRELSELIKKTLNTMQPTDLTSFAYRDTFLTIKCAPFEGHLGTKGAVLIAFER